MYSIFILKMLWSTNIRRRKNTRWLSRVIFKPRFRVIMAAARIWRKCVSDVIESEGCFRNRARLKHAHSATYRRTKKRLPFTAHFVPTQRCGETLIRGFCRTSCSETNSVHGVLSHTSELTCQCEISSRLYNVVYPRTAIHNSTVVELSVIRLSYTN